MKSHIPCTRTIVIFLLPLLVCCGQAVNKTPLAAVHKGMAMDEVKKILGEPDTILRYYDSSFAWYYPPLDSPSSSNIPFVFFGSDKKAQLSSYEHHLYFDHSGREIDSTIGQGEYRKTNDYSSKHFYLTVHSSTYWEYHFRQSEGRIFTYSDSSCTVDSIRVFTLTDRSYIQTIVPEENGYICSSNQPLIIVDVNFDGDEDICIVAYLPAGPNIPHFYWIYDRISKKFIRNNELEKIPAAEFDQKNREISSFVRDNAAHYIETKYKFIDGKITLISETDELYGDGYKLTTVSKLVNGKMKVIRRLRTKG